VAHATILRRRTLAELAAMLFKACPTFDRKSINTNILTGNT
jgi:hypothetical protein